MFQDRRRLLCLAYLYFSSQSRGRRWWVRPINENRRNQGDYHNLLQELRLTDIDGYFNYLRMTPATFDELLRLIGPSITKETCIRELICPGQRLALTIRHLANGDNIPALAYSFRLGKSTVCKIIKETTAAIWTVLKTHVFMEPIQDNWKKVAKDFNRQWNFPNCIGAIDGKHIAMQAPPNSGSEFYNYKHFHSIVLLGVCDANYVFLMVDIGASGRQSDGGIFKNSVLYNRIINKTLNIPSADNLPSSIKTAPYVIVGDEAFPLTTYLMRPYPGRAGAQLLSPCKRVFNYRLSRARRVIENTFGIMAARWRILRNQIVASVTTVENTVKAVTCLHNYLQIKSNAERIENRRYCPRNYVDLENINTGEVTEGDWRHEVDGLRSIGQTSTNTYSRNAAETRQTFDDFFSSEGAVPWQWRTCNIDMNDIST